MHYTVCYFTGIFYAVVKQISMLFIDNKDSVSSRKDGSAEENNKQTNKQQQNYKEKQKQAKQQQQQKLENFISTS